MDSPIIHILGIAPYEGMKSAMERAAEDYPSIQMDVYTGDLDEGVAIVQKVKPNTYDCIISRGGTAELIRSVTDLPVVEIQISVYDVLRVIKLVENYSNLYAVVGFPSITGPAHTVCDLLRYNLDILTVHSIEEVTATLSRLQQGGYRMVVSDMVTHTIARQMGLDAFLITSGVESLHAALDQALTLSAGFRRLRQENLFLRNLAQMESDIIAVLNEKGNLQYSTSPAPQPELLEVLRAKIGEVPEGAPLKFYHNDAGTLYTVTAQGLSIGRENFYLFRCQPAQIPLRTGKSGIRVFGKGECEHLFMNSFYSISGSLGELESSLSSIAATRQPVMITGENGTGKEQIARVLYLRGPRSNRPFAVIDCALIEDKSWDYLLNHYSSPLNDSGSTLYFQHLEKLTPARSQELLSAMLDTGLNKRERLLFSCTCMEEEALPENGQLFASRLGCLTMRLPTLRSRSDEIPSLATLYLGNLNLELGKQISGFDAQAIEQLRHYNWPNNYTQFKQVLYELSTLANSSYIRSSSVAELLAKERALTHVRPSRSAADAVMDGLTLEQITYAAVQRALEAHGGNQSAAAKQLGISRTTIWRYLNVGGVSEEK